MNPKYQPLFEPFELNNGVSVKNRLVLAPLTLWASHDDGTISEDELAFFSRRAVEFGLAVYSATLVSPNGKAFKGQPAAFADNSDGLRQAAATIKNQGAKAILQLHHGGAKAVPELVDEVVAPSAYQDGVRALQAVDIEQIIADFAAATSIALQAGFDGVEINGANGFLLQQFVSRHSNHRTDKWGEPHTFALAVIDAVKNAVKHRPDFIVGYRFSPEEAEEQGLTMADTLALVDELANQPLQYLHISLWDFYRKARRGADENRNRIELVHEKIAGRLPLIGVGALFTADDLLSAKQTGWAEFLAVGKAAMMNPNFAELIAQGKEDQIQTELDPTRPDRYAIPPHLWAMCQKGNNWLPPVKGMAWEKVAW
ncbi:TPA: NADH-dependent flavin oxidoreductase [Mannheimia haemolytica]